MNRTRTVPAIRQDEDEIGRLPRHIMYPAFLALGAAMWIGIAYGGTRLVEWL